MKINYQLILDETLKNVQKDGVTPSLLLHSCCAPCSSYVLEYLSEFFRITVFYYNPNIAPEDEYRHRVEEQKRLIHEMPLKNAVLFLEGNYNQSEFFDTAKGMEQEPEGGRRCYECYKLRLRKTAQAAAANHFDYFTSTLSVSPYKKADWINEIGEQLAKEFSIPFLHADFKKRNGYKRSIELSSEYGLYRQNYCGCIFSKREEPKL